MEKRINMSRALLEWQWSDEPNMVALWTHLLLRAAHKAKYWGVTTECGQVAASRRKLAGETGLSERQVRTALRRLAQEGSIKVQVINRCLFVTIRDFDKYVSDEETTKPSDPPSVPTFNNATNYNATTYRKKATRRKGTASQLDENEAATRPSDPPSVPTFGNTTSYNARTYRTEATQSGNTASQLEAVSKPSDPPSVPTFGNTTSYNATTYRREATQSGNTASQLDEEATKPSDPPSVPTFSNATSYKATTYRTEATESENTASQLAIEKEKSNQKRKYSSSSSSSSSPRACVRAKEWTAPQLDPGPPIECAEVRRHLDGLLGNDGYLQLVYYRAGMDEAAARQYVPEFCAQVTLRQARYPDLQRLGEHFANWLGKKKKYEDERSRAKYADSREALAEERERERHSAVLQGAYALIASSSRDD